MAHSRRQFLRVSVLGLGGVTVASLLAACGGAGPSAAPGKPAESKPAETQAGRGREASSASGGSGQACRGREAGRGCQAGRRPRPAASPAAARSSC